jgi:hypothetical protein
MLSELEKKLELKISKQEQLWQIEEELAVFRSSDETLPLGVTVVTG